MQKNYKTGIATAIASSNIAFIKYWGKRDSSINLPNNSSISMTLDSGVSTTTSVMFTDKLDADTIFINSERQKLEDKSSEKMRFIKEALDYSRKKHFYLSKVTISEGGARSCLAEL